MPHPLRTVDYDLVRSSVPIERRARVVPSKGKGRLRPGGGRKPSIGWTKHTRRSNRLRLDSLRPHIKSVVTIRYPSRATPEQLQSFNRCAKNFCKEKGIPARSVWEGPGKHHHIPLCIHHAPTLETLWKARLAKLWGSEFDEPLPDDAFLWDADVDPDEVASYVGKSKDKQGRLVKRRFPWLTFNPVWEVGIRALLNGRSEGRKKRVNEMAIAGAEKEGHTNSPHYTVPPAEKESGAEVRAFCQTCARRWGKELWERSCVCTGHVSLRFDVPG